MSDTCLTSKHFIFLKELTTDISILVNMDEAKKEKTPREFEWMVYITFLYHFSIKYFVNFILFPSSGEAVYGVQGRV